MTNQYVYQEKNGHGAVCYMLRRERRKMTKEDNFPNGTLALLSRAWFGSAVNLSSKEFGIVLHGLHLAPDALVVGAFPKVLRNFYFEPRT